MALEKLASTILSKSGFQKRLDAIIVGSLRSDFPKLTFDSAPSAAIDWDYLLLVASLFTRSDNEDCQRAALKIAEHCLNTSETLPAQRSAAGIILDCMANKPSIELAKKRKLLHAEFQDQLPMPLRQDYARRSLENVIVRAGGVLQNVNHFQKAFWDAIKTSHWVSVSAPTSAGKSFIIKTWIEDFSRKNPAGKIVYLVPTRALIQEVQRDLESHFGTLGLNRVVVHTLPNKGEIDLDKINVFVFTQERFHLILSATNDDFTFDIVVIDEAQKVGDGSRGVLLQQVLDEAIRRSAKTKCVFASPQTENPDYLLSGAPEGTNPSAITKSTVTVSQNLLWASQRERKPMIWDIFYRDGEKALSVGTVTLPFRPTPTSKRLSFVAYEMRSQKGGNLIYVNGAADAEKIADQIYDLATEYEDVGRDPRIQDLIDLIKKTVHPKYTLAETLKRGVAYHYGNMPLLVRSEIERLFSENAIPFLICTSTLIEGVNLPCKVIFARGPEKGRGKNIDAQDFWNLAGRAGRWGKEFQGHIVCIDPTDENVWGGVAPKKRFKTKIRGVSHEVISAPSLFLDYISSGFAMETRKISPEFDYIFGYLASALLRDGNLQRIAPARDLSVAVRNKLEMQISESLKNSRIPEEIIRRNPGILPVDMQRIYQFFSDQNDNVGNYVPVLPESEDAVDTYERILGVINTIFNASFGEEKRIKSLAILMVNWMKGRPLAVLISDRQKYSARKGTPINLQQLIRSVMADVEQFARFQAPKFLNCYIDILKLFAQKTGRETLLADLPDLGIYLEFGVSTPTQLSLISLGLSRTSTLAISERIARHDLDKSGILDWLKQREWENMDVLELVKAEIRAVLRSIVRA